MKHIAVLICGIVAAPLMAADPVQLTGQIDKHIEAGWKANSITPAQPADDAEFLRRVYLDLAGRIPAVQEVREFLRNQNPDKRRELVDRLLEGSGYIQHFATVWRREWLPQTLSNPQFQFFGTQFEPWIRQQLRNNTPYDKIVRELLTVSPATINGGFDPVNGMAGAFLQVNELKPENVASAASRLFLGVKLECAQCHNHPFDAYTRKQFWEFASFFAGLQPVNPRVRRAPAEAVEIHALTIPGTETRVSARFLDGKEPKFEEKVSPRIALVEWMTAKDNPYFARNAVNRMWANFFGVGLMDPLDEPGDKNPPSHPELLDELARSFAASGYDLKYLIKAIVGSKAYQLSSAGPASSKSGERVFARMQVRGLTPEQLFDSLSQATLFSGDIPAAQRQFVAPNTPRGEFLARFSSTERLSEVQTSILQALTLMNGKFVGEMTNSEQGRMIGSVDAPFFDTPEKIDILFLATVSRFPRPEELKKLTAYVQKGGQTGDARKALTDIYWALLNGSEFAFNH
jgi:Protein of unknown function (DUF1553)/Protein of unknown function (DUF1549)